jgi:hypothetical protein
MALTLEEQNELDGLLAETGQVEQPKPIGLTEPEKQELQLLEQEQATRRKQIDDDVKVIGGELPDDAYNILQRRSGGQKDRLPELFSMIDDPNNAEAQTTSFLKGLVSYRRQCRGQSSSAKSKHLLIGSNRRVLQKNRYGQQQVLANLKT